MNKTLRALIFAIMLCGVALAEVTERQLVREQLPEYPSLLKKLGIGGTVRLNALVAADGTVKSTTIQGGNPVLSELASGAVKKWKYAPSAQSSNEAVEIVFDAKLATVRVK